MSDSLSLSVISTSSECSLSSLVSHTLTQYGNVPLEVAAVKGHTETVQRLLELGANPNHQNKVRHIESFVDEIYISMAW